MAKYNEWKTGAAPRDADAGRMAISGKGLRLLLAGLVVMVAGYVLMAGGGSDDPQVFNYAMFNFRRLVAAPVMIIAGIIIEVVAIMKVYPKEK